MFANSAPDFLLRMTTLEISLILCHSVAPQTSVIIHTWEWQCKLSIGKKPRDITAARHAAIYLGRSTPIEITVWILVIEKLIWNSESKEVCNSCIFHNVYSISDNTKKRTSVWSYIHPVETCFEPLWCL